MNSTIAAISLFGIISTTTTTITTTTEENSLLATSLSLTSKHNKLDDVSPVTLSSEWSRMARLLLISFLAVIGSVGNVFMISSVMIEDHLKKAGKCKLRYESNSRYQIVVIAFI